jgi:hypothetical protein
MNEKNESEPKIDPETEFKNLYDGLFRKYNNFLAMTFMCHGVDYAVFNIYGGIMFDLNPDLQERYGNLRKEYKYDEAENMLYEWLATAGPDIQKTLTKLEGDSKSTRDYRSAMTQAGIIEEDYAKLVKIIRLKDKNYQITEEDVNWLKDIDDKIENAFGILEEMGYSRRDLIT